MYDLVIIGGSISGVAAAIYAVRRKLNFVLLSKDIGGEVALAGEIKNYPGILDTTGVDMAAVFREQIKSYEMPFEEGAEVTGITQKDGAHVVTAKVGEEEKTYESKSVIIATGIHPRHLGVPGEEEFYHKGVTYCTVCDGPLFKGKTTATIGAGNSALESAIMMAGISEKVYLISNKKESEGEGFPKGDGILVEKIKAMDNVEIIYNALTQKIEGDQMVSSITYKDADSNEEKTIEVQAAMVHIGFVPNSDFVQCVEKDKAKQIVTDKLCQTSCDGIFAAGDVTDIPYKQIAIAGGQGVTACLNTIDYLNKQK